MTRTRTSAIDGYRIQPMLPMAFPYFGGVIEDAEFTVYDNAWRVEASVRMGIISSPYTLVLTIGQALAADVIERA